MSVSVCVCLCPSVYVCLCVSVCTCGRQWSSWGTSSTCPCSIGLTLIITMCRPVRSLELLPADVLNTQNTVCTYCNMCKLRRHNIISWQVSLHQVNTKSSRPLRLLLIFQPWVQIFAWNFTWLSNNQIYTLSPSLIEIYCKMSGKIQDKWSPYTMFITKWFLLFPTCDN